MDNRGDDVNDTTQHNHPPRCCCIPDKGPLGPGDRCPLCPEHGELAQLANAECPSCHQLPGRPPTEYCQTPRAHIRSGNGFTVPAGYTEHDAFADAVKTLASGIPVARADGITEPPVADWVDNGCRCPTAVHLARCPTQPHPYVQATDDDGAPVPDCCERCGKNEAELRHDPAFTE